MWTNPENENSQERFERLPEFLSGMVSEGFPCQKQQVKTGRGSPFFKYTDTYTKLQEYKESGNHDIINGTK